jgi:hypothetical protein
MKKKINYRIRVKFDAKGLTNLSISINSENDKYNLNLKNVERENIDVIRKYLETDVSNNIAEHKLSFDNFLETVLPSSKKVAERNDAFGEKGFHEDKIEELREETKEAILDNNNIFSIGKYKFARFSGNIYFSEILSLPVPESLLQLMKDSNEYKLDCLINFFKLLALNPDTNIVEQITDYVVRGQFKLTNLGFLVGYKKVQSRNTEPFNIARSSQYFLHLLKSNIQIGYADLIDRCEFTDSHSGRMTIKNGHLITMPRQDCDSNPDNSCSTGLHIGTFAYSNSFTGNTLLLCLFSPSDIANLPYREANKLRASAYIPLGILPNDSRLFLNLIETNDFRLNPDVIFEAKRNLEVFFSNNKDIQNLYTDYISTIDTHISFIEVRQILNSTANTALTFVKPSEEEFVKVKLTKPYIETVSMSLEDEDLDDDSVDDLDIESDEDMYEEQDNDEEVNPELEEFKSKSIGKLNRMRWKAENYCVVLNNENYELVHKDKIGDRTFICNLI